ncbi:unnamed protein product [Victoria cruziana]
MGSGGKSQSVGSCGQKGVVIMGGRYLLWLSLVMNVALLTSLVYERGHVRKWEKGMVAGGNQICLQERDGSGAEQHAKFCSAAGKVSSCNNSSGGSGSASLPAPTLKLSSDAIINLDHGDPKMFEQFWRGAVGERADTLIPGWQAISYFSTNAAGTVCWFLEPSLEQEVRRLHRLVGNAQAGPDRHVVVGTGSTQLFQAALYALSPPDVPHPVSVVSALPFYSSYPVVTDYLKSGIYKWVGDAHAFNEIPRHERGPHIELVTSPNNPDGFKREQVVEGNDGKLVYDLAYYWPQYSPITSSFDAGIMLFTASKSTGHAGTRIGWALVKDKEVARKMTKFIELNTIGVSKDSQIRTAKILGAISDAYERESAPENENFFRYSKDLMRQRWKSLRDAIKFRGRFSLPEFPTEFCNFFGEEGSSYPAFAWAKCEAEEIDDCAAYLKANGILTRSGKLFGVDPKFVRISMMDRDDTFNLFIERMSKL